MRLKEKNNLYFVVPILVTIIMLFLGLFISHKIQQSLIKKYNEYDNIPKIETESVFRQGLKDGVGLAFIYGNLETIDPVSYPEISGSYCYIKKVTQKYQKHTKKVREKYKDSNGAKRTRTKKKHYHSWDTINTCEKTSKKLSFLNVEFPYDKIPLPSYHKITTITISDDTREIYYGIDSHFNGTIYTTLKDGTINQTLFYQNLTIDETLKNFKSGHYLFAFWVLWILLMLVIDICIYNKKINNI